MIECCANCKKCIAIPRNNRYGDIDYFCIATGYYLHGILKDRSKVKRFSPGGKELECQYEASNGNFHKGAYYEYGDKTGKKIR